MLKRSWLAQFVVMLAAAFLLAGCASMTNKVPRTPEQMVFATYGLYVTVENTTAQMLRTHQISHSTAQSVYSQLHKWHPTLNASHKAVVKGKAPTSAQMKALQAIQSGLLQLQRQLQAKATTQKGGKP